MSHCPQPSSPELGGLCIFYESSNGTGESVVIQQIRNSGCDQLEATQVLQGTVCHFRATEVTPLLMNNWLFELSF